MGLIDVAEIIGRKIRMGSERSYEKGKKNYNNL